MVPECTDDKARAINIKVFAYSQCAFAKFKRSDSARNCIVISKAGWQNLQTCNGFARLWWAESLGLCLVV